MITFADQEPSPPPRRIVSSGVDVSMLSSRPTEQTAVLQDVRKERERERETGEEEEEKEEEKEEEDVTGPHTGDGRRAQ